MAAKNGTKFAGITEYFDEMQNNSYCENGKQFEICLFGV
jgi:hypothetical protein